MKKEADRLGRYFRFIIDSERMDIMGSARNYIKSEILNGGQIKRFPKISSRDDEMMKKREAFLMLRLENNEKKNVLNGKFEVSQMEKDQLLSREALRNETYGKKTDLWCQWCASREICLEPYRAVVGD